MAKMGGISVVSYGIGVQNRYSAFLDDEEGFVSPSKTNAPKISASNKRVEQNSTKQKSLSSGKVTNTTNSTANNKTLNSNGGQRKVAKQEQNADSKNQAVSYDGKRQRAGNESNSKKFNKPGNFNQEHNANEKKFHSNGNHQLNASQHANSSREDGENHGSKHVKNNHNSGVQARTRQRSFYNDHDGKKNEPLNDSHSNGFGHPMNEEEKRRRQQKRFLDLKHKDPEKKEARQQRQQAATDGSKQALNNSSEQAQKDAKVGFRGQRRNSGPNSGKPQAEESKAQNGFARGRGRRPDQVRDATNGVRQDGQAVNGQSSRGGAQQRNNRVPRSRNGFGGGSRGSRGPKDGEPGRTRRDSENHKPIPNFSDKSDFPSLAS